MGDRVCPADLVTWLEYLCVLLPFACEFMCGDWLYLLCIMFGPCQLCTSRVGVCSECCELSLNG